MILVWVTSTVDGSGRGSVNGMDNKESMCMTPLVVTAQGSVKDDSI